MLLICLSLVARDGEHFLMYFLGICVSSFEKRLFRSFACVLVGLFGLVVVVVLVLSFYISL